MRAAAIVLAAWIATGGTAPAACPLGGEKPMRVVQLFFGQKIGEATGTVQRVSRRAWAEFLSAAMTPAFPDGFTVYDAYGQWADPKTGRIVREPSKIVVIAVPQNLSVESRLKEIVRRYRQRFHQQSVGVLTTDGCGEF